MAKELARLLLRIEADTSRLKRELKVTEDATRQSGTRMSRAFARASRSLEGLTRSMFSARGAAVALAGAGALGLAIKRSIDFADNIAKTADSIAISTDALQELRFAADLAGVEQEKLDKALQKATRSIGELERSSSELDTALRDLAPALLEDMRAANSVEEALDLAFRAMANMEDQTRRAAVANALFGRSGILMTNLVRDGADAFDEARQAARDLGIVIEERLLRQVETVKDQMTILATVIKANFTRGLISGFTDEFVNFADVVKDPAFADAMRAFGDSIGGTLRFMVENHRPITAVLAGLLAFGTVGRVNVFAGIFAGLAAGGATFIALGDDILTAEDALTRLADKMEELRFIEDALVRERAKAARGSAGAAENVQTALEQRSRVLGEILEIEQAIAAASRDPTRTDKPSRGAVGDDGGSADATATKAKAEVDKLIASVALLERQLDAASGEVSTLVNEQDIQRVEQLVAGLDGAARIDLAKTLDEAGFAGANLEESLRLLIATDRELDEALADSETAFAEIQRVLEKTRTPAERYAATIAKLESLKERGLDQETFNRAVAQASEEFIKAAQAAEKLKLENIEVTDSFESLSDAGADAMDDLIDAVEGFGREFSRTMAEALVTGDFTFKRLGQSFLVNFAEKVIQKRITDPLFNIFEGFLDNLSFGGGAPSVSPVGGPIAPGFGFLVPGFEGQAKGAVVAHGAIQPFGKGGVVDRPTLFRLAHGAGLMGEAGPEAILPLTRLPGGDLGVQAVGGGATVTVTVVNNTGAPVETRESRSGNQGRNIEIVIGRLVSGDIRSGGETFRAVRDTFNLTPATALR